MKRDIKNLIYPSNIYSSRSQTLVFRKFKKGPEWYQIFLWVTISWDKTRFFKELDFFKDILWKSSFVKGVTPEMMFLRLFDIIIVLQINKMLHFPKVKIFSLKKNEFVKKNEFQLVFFYGRFYFFDNLYYKTPNLWYFTGKWSRIISYNGGGSCKHSRIIAGFRPKSEK